MPTKDKGGKPPHQPTKQTQELVTLHATMGTTQSAIADLLEIDEKTLRKHYRKELDQSLVKATATLGGVLFNKAKAGDTTSLIFWLKTRAKWSEAKDESSENNKPITINFVDAQKPDGN